MKRFSIFITCLLVFLTWISAFAQDSQGQPGPSRRGGLNGERRVNRPDVNNDGVISRDEWNGKSGSSTRLTRTATARSHAKSSAPLRRQAERRLNQMDTNNDGKISRDEWKGVPKRFDRFDGGGGLTKEEIRSHPKNQAADNTEERDGCNDFPLCYLRELRLTSTV